MAHRALVLGSELLSPYHHLGDEADLSNDTLATLAMMGDGAGAVVLEAGHPEAGGIRHIDFAAIGVNREPGVILRKGGALAACEADDAGGAFSHNFRLILKHSSDILEYWLRWAERNRVDLDTIRWVIPPQATTYALKDAARRAHVSIEKFVNLFPSHANTASAGIYIALDHLNRSGRLRRGDRIHLLPTEASKWLYGVIDLEWSLGEAA
jgi:3-oxoacyl-[acyl-carrier-protein] synthase-3